MPTAYSFSAGSDISNPANYTPNGTPVAGDTVSCSRSVTTGTAAGTWTVSGVATLSGCTFNGPVTGSGSVTYAAGAVFNAGLTITNGSQAVKEFASTIPSGQTLTFTGDGMANGLKLVAGANVAGNISTTAGIRWAAGTFTGKLIQPGGNLWAAGAITFPPTVNVDGGVQYGPDGTEYECTGLNLATLTAALAGAVNVNLIAAVAGNSVTIVKGDDYLSTNDPATTWTEPSNSGWPADLTAWTLTFVCTKAADNTNTGADLSVAFTVSPVTGSSRVVTFNLTKAQTATLALDPSGKAGYTYRLVATKGTTQQRTLLMGSMFVK